MSSTNQYNTFNKNLEKMRLIKTKDSFYQHKFLCTAAQVWKAYQLHFSIHRSFYLQYSVFLAGLPLFDHKDLIIILVLEVVD